MITKEKLSPAANIVGLSESILKNIAIEKYDQYEETATQYVSEGTEEEMRKLDVFYEEIIEELADLPELQKMIRQYSEESTSVKACSEEDYFVNGFLEGIRFIQRLNYEIKVIS